MFPDYGRTSPGCDQKPRGGSRSPWRSTTMNRCLRLLSTVTALGVLIEPGVGRAQMHHHPAAADTTAHRHAKPAGHVHGVAPKSTHASGAMSGMDMAGM